MRRLLVRGPLIVLLAVLFMLDARGAGAIVEWCRTDPVLDIGGERMHVFVSGPVDLLQTVTGPTIVEITVPAGVPYTLVSTDAGFGLGWDVRITESDQLRVGDRGTEVRVRTSVPASTNGLRVMMEVTDGNQSVLDSRTSSTNGWQTVKVWL